METRDKILATATSLFSELGYENCSVDRIAKAADVSKGAIYYCFENKEDILFSIAENGIAEFEKNVKLSISKGVDKNLVFQETINAYVDLFFDNKDLCIIIMRDLLCTKSNITQKKTTDLTNQLFKFTALVLQTGQYEGVVKKTNSLTLARIVCSVLYGFLLFPESGDRKEASLEIKKIIE